MFFKYEGITKEGGIHRGGIDAVNESVAVKALQERGLHVLSIQARRKSIFEWEIPLLSGVSNKEVVLLSRQMATLFEAQVSALRIFYMLSDESDNLTLKRILQQIGNDLEGGTTMSDALSRHPKVFSSFYVSMVKAGEQTGRLDQTFGYLADHLQRTYETTSRAKHALVYPAVILAVFVTVSLLMLTFVIPRVADIILSAGEELPVYTKLVLGVNDFLMAHGLLLLIFIIVAGIVLYKWVQTSEGKRAFDTFKIEIPVVGDLYRKLYLSRISDNMNTMISSGISMIESLEITADVVDNEIYRDVLKDALEVVKAGQPMSVALSRHDEIPAIMVQMTRVGEETGQLGHILSTLARFYQQEVRASVNTLVGLIEPALIILFSLVVGTLLVSILTPIYSITAGGV